MTWSEIAVIVASVLIGGVVLTYAVAPEFYHGWFGHDDV